MTNSLTAMPASLASRFHILIVEAQMDKDSAIARSIDEIIAELDKLGRPVVVSRTLDDAEAAVSSHRELACVVIGWGLAAQSDASLEQTKRLLRSVRQQAALLPVLLGAGRSMPREVPLEIVKQIEGFIWVPEDSAAFIAGRIEAAVKRYLDTVLPPFFGGMVNFADTHEYSWHTPGHTGGTAYMKTAVGRTFLDFFGEQLLRSDLSVSVGELGSLNDHSGAVADAERYAAQVYGADHTFFVVGGSSASNSIVLRSSVADADIALVDRNCHKSLNYALNVSGAIPIYLKPRRNARGVIGPVPTEEIHPETIRNKIEQSPLVEDKRRKPVIAALTNSTYDGLCYDVEQTTELFSQSVDRIHYDEAWYAYARFNPIYEGRYGMHRGRRSAEDATVTTTHSTHKCLAALSQASMIHIRPGRVPVEPAMFNESFMMFTTTSPNYSVIASTDVSAKMMDDAGPALTDECIREAIDFRKAMLRIRRDLEASTPGDWWFEPWQRDEVDGIPFLDVDNDVLATSPDAWMLKPNEDWHGFGDLGRHYCMLDPIKVTTLTPGIGSDGKLTPEGIPAPLVSSFLSTQGIVAEKTEPYSILTLFTVGITKGKWGSLIAGFMRFKELHDANAPLTTVLPELAADHPERYGHMGLADLATEMHAAMGEHDILGTLDAAFNDLPPPVMSPRESFAKLVRGEVEEVAVSEAEGRTVAVQIVPYPPGIPLLMPGERFSEQTPAVREYLLGLEKFDAKFPGFEHHTHGVTAKRDQNGRSYYSLYCIKD